MYYVIFAQDIPNTLEKRLAVREQHLARLKQLQAENRLLTAGPNPAIDDENPSEAGFTGSTVIAQFENLQGKRLGCTRSLCRSWRICGCYCKAV
ncbi:hypothetical protein CHBNV3_01770 [Haemophilus influenzae]|nr:hypothetical protein CGSHiII_06349 [Haemophilus influenzae PittII]BBF15174.1 hypothetical protein CHBNV3_01770 [Haemophilus influenzae]